MALAVPLALEELSALDTVLGRKTTLVARADHLPARARSPAPARPEDRADHALRRAGRDVDCELVDAPFSEELKVEAHRFEVPVPNERARVDDRPRRADELGEAEPLELRADELALRVRHRAQRALDVVGRRASEIVEQRTFHS